MGCSRGVPGLFRGVPGVFRGCFGVFRGVPGFIDTPQRTYVFSVSRIFKCSSETNPTENLCSVLKLINVG